MTGSIRAPDSRRQVRPLILTCWAERNPSRDRFHRSIRLSLAKQERSLSFVVSIQTLGGQDPTTCRQSGLMATYVAFVE